MHRVSLPHQPGHKMSSNSNVSRAITDLATTISVSWDNRLWVRSAATVCTCPRLAVSERGDYEVLSDGQAGCRRLGRKRREDRKYCSLGFCTVRSEMKRHRIAFTTVSIVEIQHVTGAWRIVHIRPHERYIPYNVPYEMLLTATF